MLNLVIIQGATGGILLLIDQLQTAYLAAAQVIGDIHRRYSLLPGSERDGTLSPLGMSH